MHHVCIPPKLWDHVKLWQLEKRQSQTRMCYQCDGFWEQQDEICFTLEICMVFLKLTLNKPCITPLLQSVFFICAVC